MLAAAATGRCSTTTFPVGPSAGRSPTAIYDLAYNDGYVVVGTSHETPAFAVAAIRRWWMEVGRRRYPEARRLLIEADGGGANGCRKWAWKVALQRLADEFGLIITVTHYPPGASKWNPIDHRMFSLISANWAGEPLGELRDDPEVHPHDAVGDGLPLPCASGLEGLPAAAA